MVCPSAELLQIRSGAKDALPAGVELMVEGEKTAGALAAEADRAGRVLLNGGPYGLASARISMCAIPSSMYGSPETTKPSAP